MDCEVPYSYSMPQIRKLAVYSGFISAILVNYAGCFTWNLLLQRLKQSNHIIVNELIKKMIEVYGWTIEENGEPGKSAKFTIRISKIDRNSKMKTD